jgi:hypothetical protein
MSLVPFTLFIPFTLSLLLYPSLNLFFSERHSYYFMNCSDNRLKESFYVKTYILLLHQSSSLHSLSLQVLRHVCFALYLSGNTL